MEKENINTIIESLPQDLLDRIDASWREMVAESKALEKEFGFPEMTNEERKESMQQLLDTFEQSK